MKAKRKELAKRSLDEFGAGSGLTQIVDQKIQTRERLGKIVEGDAATAAAELVRLLQNEAKVL